MDERRRFQLALGGIATCLLIAALFVSSAPPIEPPDVRSPKPFFRLASTVPDRPTFPSRGCGIQVPAETPRYAPTRPRPPVLRSSAVGQLVAVRSATSPEMVESAESVPLKPRAPRIALTSAPGTETASVVLPAVDPMHASGPAHDRDPVTGVFVTAGKEVGRGFRTAGRAIKSIF